MADSTSKKAKKRKRDLVPDSESEDETLLPVCPYGAKCYRKNPVHFKEFSHPKKDEKDDEKDTSASTSGSSVDASAIDTSKLPPCKYGAGCYRKNLLHFAEFSHPVNAGPTDTADGSGSDTDVYDSDTDKKANAGSKKDPQKSELLKRGGSLVKNYSQMTEEERKNLIKKALEMKKELQNELDETKKKVEEKDKELAKMQDQVNTGLLLVDGEKEALEGDKTKFFELMAERHFKEGSAEQLHFRVAESQFYRLLAGGFGSNYKIKKVEYVVNPELIKEFKAAREDLKKTRGEKYSLPVLAFHGTAEKNITPICETGFRMPGAKGFKHKSGNKGFYGYGVYFSEYPSYSIGYIVGSQKLLLSQILIGKVYRCKGLEMGALLKDGFDSHSSPCGKELVIFKKSYILPCYIVHYECSTGEFKYKKPQSEKKPPLNEKALLALYKKAAKKKNSSVLSTYHIRLVGDLVDDHGAIKTFITKHGGNVVDDPEEKGWIHGRRIEPMIRTYNCVVSNLAEVDKGIRVSKYIRLAPSFTAPIVTQEFIFDSIVKGELQDPEEYTIEPS